MHRITAIVISSLRSGTVWMSFVELHIVANFLNCCIFERYASETREIALPRVISERKIGRKTPPAGLEPAIFRLEVRRLVHKAKGAAA